MEHTTESTIHTTEIPHSRRTSPIPAPNIIDIPPYKEPRLPRHSDVVALGTPSCADYTRLPSYTPMYDYLRSQRCNQAPLILQASNQPPLRVQIYSDEPSPFHVDIDLPSAPPPSYNESFTQHQDDIQRLIRAYDDNGNAAALSEQIFKWFISVIIMALTLAAFYLTVQKGR